MLNWIKKGLVFRPSGEGEWMNSHAQVPTALVMKDRLRVYFASRSTRSLSLTTYVDLDRDDPTQILHLNTNPILEPGKAGMFDEHGIMPSFVTYCGDDIWLYYGGWSRRHEVPYSNWTGIAVSRDDGQTFERMFDGPVIDRTPTEVFSATAPTIQKRDNVFHVWYASGKSWQEIDGRMEEYYTIVHGLSEDGINWRRDGIPIFSESGPPEPKHRPATFFFENKFHMLFGRRQMRDFRDGKNGYRLGYAHSDDLIHWHRDDSLAGLTVSDNGWDSTMTAYPYVVQFNGRTLLFYNGNGFGQAGFGVAELKNGES